MTTPNYSRRWRSEFEDERLSVSLEIEPLSASHEVAPRTSPAVVLQGVTKSYLQDGQRREVLRGVDLSLRAGEIHGILGPSGAGKTTLLRCLLRLEQPDGGKMYIAGRDWATLSSKELRSERHRVGVIFQHLNLLASCTVLANVALPLEIAGWSRPLREARAQELLRWFGISEKADEHPARLSGGQRQRVALARALATSPSVLLADEPTSALDTETKLSVLNILREIRDEFGLTILLITHDLQAASIVCDRLSLLDAGRIVETGSTEDIMFSPSSEAARRLFLSSASPLPVKLRQPLPFVLEREGGA